MEILAFLILSLPTVVEAIADVREWKKDIRDRKGLDVALRVGAMAYVGVMASLFTDKAWWQGALLSGGIFILTFDYIMGYLLTKRPTFLGTTSRIDRFLRNFHWPIVLFFRGVVFAILATIYYDLHKVLYGNW